MARKNNKTKHKKYHELLVKREQEREKEKKEKTQKKEEKDFFNNFKISLDDKPEIKEDMMEEEDKKVGKVKRKKIYKIPGRPASHFKPKLRKLTRSTVLPDPIHKGNKAQSKQSPIQEFNLSLATHSRQRKDHYKCDYDDDGS